MARPKEFDTDLALDAAMQAFWAKGYEATSMADLVEVMGLKKGSIYQAFGDKHSLFLATLQRYADQTYGAFKSILNDAETPYDGIRELLTKALVFQASVGGIRKGCFITNTTVELGPHDDAAKTIVAHQNKRLEKLLAKTISEAQNQGQIRADIDAKHLAVQVGVVVGGMMADCKSGLSKARTAKAAETFLKMLEP